ncbi:MAG TPA: hypothetical protein VMT12_15785 [Syntrophales bacterium]|nr:hypothetical protein [Syntrophales bacterium]
MVKFRASPWQAREKLYRPTGYERHILPAMGWARERSGKAGILRCWIGIKVPLNLSGFFVLPGAGPEPRGFRGGLAARRVHRSTWRSAASC